MHDLEVGPLEESENDAGVRVPGRGKGRGSSSINDAEGRYADDNERRDDILKAMPNIVGVVPGVTSLASTMMKEV